MARVVHFEIPADDPQRVIEFFEKAFGWTFQKWEGPFDYWLVMTGKEGEPGIDGGITLRDSGNPSVINTIDVADLDASIAQVETHGGSIAVPKMPVPGVGYMAYFKNPEGNLHGMMQSDPEAA